MELAVDALVQVMKKNQILSVDREDRGELSVDELSQVGRVVEEQSRVQSINALLEAPGDLFSIIHFLSQNGS
jgi:hypothetical protein